MVVTLFIISVFFLIVVLSCTSFIPAKYQLQKQPSYGVNPQDPDGMFYPVEWKLVIHYVDDKEDGKLFHCKVIHWNPHEKHIHH